MPDRGGLQVVPIDLKTAIDYINAHHRHHKKLPGHRFSVGVAKGRLLVGVALVGNPTSRVIQAEGGTLEVRRTATDGTANANSMLYATCWQAAKALGWSRLITYTQDGETGGSLRAAGYRVVAERPARGGWDNPSRPRMEHGTSGIARTLWEA